MADASEKRTCAELLEQARSTGTITDAHGTPRPINSEINDRFCAALSGIVAREQPKLVIEIGMACGFSTLAILTALPEGSRLLSIDPFQHQDYHGLGHAMVSRSDRALAHTLIEEPDYLALPRLLGEGTIADLVYIDGMHTFDYVALDAFYADKLINVGGIIAFNDCGFRSIHKFLNYFVKHRDYEEIDVGLAPDYRGGNPLITVSRQLTGRSNQDRYFRKKSDWEPPHNYFKSF